MKKSVKIQCSYCLNLKKYICTPDSSVFTKILSSEPAGFWLLHKICQYRYINIRWNLWHTTIRRFLMIEIWQIYGGTFNTLQWVKPLNLVIVQIIPSQNYLDDLLFIDVGSRFSIYSEMFRILIRLAFHRFWLLGTDQRNKVKFNLEVSRSSCAAGSRYL